MVAKKITALTLSLSMIFAIGGASAVHATDTVTSSITDKSIIPNFYIKMCQVEEFRYFVLSAMFNTFVPTVLEQIHKEYMLKKPISFQKELEEKIKKDPEFARKISLFQKLCEENKDYTDKKIRRRTRGTSWTN